MEVAGEFQDDYSGAKLDRPGIDCLRAAIDRREIEAVIVFASDRLTRNLAHLLLLRRTAVADRGLRDNASLAPPCSTPRPKAGIAADHRRRWSGDIRSRHRFRGQLHAQRDKKAETGLYVLGGRLPFGYRMEAGQAVIYEPEAQIVRQMFAWYTFGEETLPPFSLMEITRRLNDTEVRCQRGGSWCPTTVLTMLKREQYAGRFLLRQDPQGQAAQQAAWLNVKQPPEAMDPR